jgi:hypothetical protein
MTIPITTPYDPPPEGQFYEIRLRRLGGSSTAARCEIYQAVGGRKIAEYDDPDSETPGELYPLDDTGDSFHFADQEVFYVRGTGTFGVKVWTDDAGNASSVEAEVVIGGNG